MDTWFLTEFRCRLSPAAALAGGVRSPALRRAWGAVGNGAWGLALPGMCWRDVVDGLHHRRGTRKPLRMWFLAMWLVTSQKNRVSALGLQRVLGLAATRQRGRGSTNCAGRWSDPAAIASPVPSRSTKPMSAARKRASEAGTNDDSERPGWDGFVEAGEATPWIPLGRSGWEFGVSKNAKGKADGDYAKSVRSVSPDERAEMTFVFVTPRRWPGKTVWEQERRAEKHWKNVRVLDASNLEEWLEQSISSQTWFANERGVPSQGLQSLDACWRNWAADCKPPLAEALFDEAIARAENTIGAKLAKTTPESVIVRADSRDEALAFLHCVFAAERQELSALRDRIVVFSKPGALTKLASKSSNFIPVVTSRAVEQELAPHKSDLRAIIVYPRNATNAEADITLEPLSYTAFEKALQQMECGRDDIDRLSRESGRSLTVLRRRLSRLEAVRTPEWASEASYARSLVPFLFSGAWRSTNSADQAILGLLADNSAYENLEGRFASLLQLDDAPVWSIGPFRGLVSKIDTLFAIHRSVTLADLDRLFDVATLVLEEDDPSLDLPEERRWLAGAYGKTREISAPLREGISETLVLLAVHGRSLFRDRLGVDPEDKVRRLVRTLLWPLTARKLEAHSGDLPMYAEASPDEFLKILEDDLALPEPEVLKLMRPASSGLFGRCPRTGLLWALENTAWSPEQLIRTVDILARLAKPVIDDNWANKPSGSLGAIFRCWMPQTAATVEQRIAALAYLAERHPEVAWSVCVAQFDGQSAAGFYSHKPRWRPDAHGYGEPVTLGQMHAFAVRALELALEWNAHTRETLGDLVSAVGALGDVHQVRIWELVDEWSRKASDEDRAWLREKVRVSTMTRRAAIRRTTQDQNKEQSAQAVERARRAYNRLKPKDVVLEHAWLFMKPWVETSADELADEKLDLRKREGRIDEKREAALRAVMRERGVEGAVALAAMGEAAIVVGRLCIRVLTTVDEQVDGIRSLLAYGPLPELHTRRSIVFGILGGLPDDVLLQVLTALSHQRDPAEIVSLLVLAPFRSATWRLVTSLGGDIEAAYWREVHPVWGRNSGDDLGLAVEQLLVVDRPRAAFQFAEYHLKKLQSKQLFRLMKSIATSAGETSGTYLLQDYRVEEALKLLGQSGQIAVDELAGLEFQYLDALRHGDDSIPNLERQMEDHPELFVQAVAFAYRRNDSGTDPDEFQVASAELAAQRAKSAHRLLERLSRIPGHNRQGDLDSDRLLNWVGRVRAACAELTRAEVGDFRIGHLLSRAPIGSDGVWPCEPVRAVIERVATERLSEGITNGLYNSRGVHYRGEGGKEERELAEKYASWARSLEFSFPRIAKILKEMVRTYEHEANWQDTEAGVRKRLRQ